MATLPTLRGFAPLHPCRDLLEVDPEPHAAVGTTHADALDLAHELETERPEPDGPICGLRTGFDVVRWEG